jgi:hypothetical protein
VFLYFLYKFKKHINSDQTNKSVQTFLHFDFKSSKYPNMAFLAALQAGQRGGMTPSSQLTASREFNRFLSVNVLAYDAESALAWLMLEACDTAMGADAHVPRVDNDQPALCARAQVAAGAAAGAQGEIWTGAANAAAPAALAEGIPLNAFRSLVADANKAIYWLLDLAACHQVKPLKATNVSNFFRMSSRIAINGREIMKVLDFAAVTLPNIMGNEQLFALLGQNQFMTYHTAYSSTAKLAQEMIDAAPAVSNAFFSPATRAAVDASAMNPHSRELNAAISQQVVLATYAYLVAFGKLPDNWFQGEKTKQALPASKYNIYLAIYRRLRALSSNTDAINAADTIDALIAVIDPSMRNV